MAILRLAMKFLAHYARSLWNNRDLVRSLVWRDFCTRYKQAVLGLGWAVLYPIALALILYVAFEVLQRGPATDKPRLLVYYAGLHAFNLFASGVIYGTISIVANGGLLTKVRVPSEAFPLSAVLSSLFDFAFAAVALVGLMWWYRDHVVVGLNVFWIPVIVAGQLIFTLAIVQVMAAACVIARDLRYGAPILCQLLLFLVPVIYEVPREVRGAWRWYMLNPLAVFVDAYRNALLDNRAPRLWYLALACALSVLCLWGSCRLFANAKDKFADVL